MDSKKGFQGLHNLEQCPNCDFSPLTPDNKYCPCCGQACKDRRITVWSLFKEAFANVFNLDNQLWQTAWNLFIPGKLTKEFFAGRHKRYISPVRMFFITALTFFAVVQLATLDIFESDSNEKKSDVFLKQLLEETDSLKADSSFSLYTPSFALDSLYERMHEQYHSDISMVLDELMDKDSTKSDSTIITEDDLAKIRKGDLVTIAKDSLLQKYGDDGFWEDLFKTQVEKLQESGASFWSYLLGKLVWMMLLMMPFLALFLKLLYVRRDFYYVDHIIFSLHTHAFTFLIFSILILLETYLPEGISDNSGYILLGLFIYFFIAMKRIYGQSKRKTFVKLLLFMFFYFILLGIAFSLTTVISVMIF